MMFLRARCKRRNVRHTEEVRVTPATTSGQIRELRLYDVFQVFDLSTTCTQRVVTYHASYQEFQCNTDSQIFELCLMKNTFQYSPRAFGVIYTDCRGSGRELSRGVRLMSYSAVPHYLKIIWSMGVGPCEWSEVKTNAATKEGFLMNTLRRISRPLVKTFAVGAVMVAAALPAMAIAGTASAATTAPTIACTVAATTGTPSCSSGYAIIGQGMTGTFVLEGTGLAFDQAVGGNVTLTTTAPGVTFTDVNETSATTLSADIDSTSATTP